MRKETFTPHQSINGCGVVFQPMAVEGHPDWTQYGSGNIATKWVKDDSEANVHCAVDMLGNRTYNAYNPHTETYADFVDLNDAINWASSPEWDFNIVD